MQDMTQMSMPNESSSGLFGIRFTSAIVDEKLLLKAQQPLFQRVIGTQVRAPTDSGPMQLRRCGAFQ